MSAGSKRALAAYYLSDLVLILLAGLAGGVTAYYTLSTPPDWQYQGAQTRIPAQPDPGLEALIAVKLDRATGSAIDDLEAHLAALGPRLFLPLAPISVLLSVYLAGVEREHGYSLMPALLGYSRRSYYTNRLLLSWAAYMLLIMAGLILALLLIDPALLASHPGTAAKPVILVVCYAASQLALATAVAFLVKRSFLAVALSMIALYAADAAEIPGALTKLTFQSLNAGAATLTLLLAVLLLVYEASSRKASLR